MPAPGLAGLRLWPWPRRQLSVSCRGGEMASGWAVIVTFGHEAWWAESEQHPEFSAAHRELSGLLNMCRLTGREYGWGDPRFLHDDGQHCSELTEQGWVACPPGGWS